jgi:hypothetical protein
MADTNPIDPALLDKNTRPKWWPEDYQGYWDEDKQQWIHPPADTDKQHEQ